ncbi:unnamed protein product [Mycena citricolor]|uniref:Uncharacterized protein n=1 Tax=Mycena citricolor TaxID=2018698 RepID=A0AAD2HPR3_9AGAR|nr:unnamed protein product [Mycena citricolor]
MSSRSSLRFRRWRLGTKYPVPVFPHHGITHSVATYVPAILTVHRQPDPRRGDTTRHAIARWNSAQSHMTAVLGRGSRYQSGCFLRPSIEVFLINITLVLIPVYKVIALRHAVHIGPS